MLRKFKITIICVFTILFALLFKNICAFCSFYIGKYYYGKQSYTAAKNYFGFSKENNPLNQTYNDFYTRTLVKVPLDFRTQKELYALTRDTSSNPAALVADNRLEKFKNTTLKRFEPNYIGAATTNSSLIRWDERKFPLKVYIAQKYDVPQEYNTAVAAAFDAWEKAFNNFFQFKYVDNPELADIRVDYQLSLNDQGKTSYYAAAYTVPKIAANTLLQHMDITINTKDNLGDSVNAKELYGTVLHEIGHALGIMGHSGNNQDLMYIQTAGKFSDADINTVKLLYLMIPDISNSPVEEMNTDARIYAPIVFGTTENLDGEQYTKAITYLQKAPNVAAGWVELANFYYQIKNYPKAVKSLLQAKQLAQSDEELYYINYNLATVYLELKDYNNALMFLKAAQDAKPDADLRSVTAYCKYQSGQKEEGMKELNSLVRENPKDIPTGLILADIYYTNMDFLSTIHVLKWLNANNTDFKHDQRLAKYKLLKLFI